MRLQQAAPEGLLKNADGAFHCAQARIVIFSFVSKIRNTADNKQLFSSPRDRCRNSKALHVDADSLTVLFKQCVDERFSRYYFLTAGYGPKKYLPFFASNGGT